MTYPPPGSNPPPQGPDYGHPGQHPPQPNMYSYGPPAPPRRNYAAGIVIGVLAVLLLFTGIGIGSYFDLGNDSDSAEISAPSTEESAPGCSTKECADTGFDIPAGNGFIDIAYLSDWQENNVISHMWKMALEDAGYDVRLHDVVSIPVVFKGLAGDDYDLFFGAWSNTHVTYVDGYSDDVEDLGSWYDSAELTLAVPEYVDEVDSIEDLADHADLFNGEITGIEDDSGITTITDEVLSTYDLDDFEQINSSTDSMLNSLDAAIRQVDPIVVPLWKPHWAYGAYDLKVLDDPEGALGETERIHTLARDYFSDEYPEAVEALQTFYMNDQELSELESVVFQDGAYEDDVKAGVLEWLRDNPFNELKK
ncbi:glycine betaine ABC transporter substrate-binding protein [Haloglycomyces albus]|uniref:glycine betaine ABC transporter substrate-binding protein n=1 Tax=Haloglycomyces albus TaxID=526067 RepID=UPI00046CD2D1|nr:glycine betaine ABC transporter substrate-binding protein [Haloglycomyces albus]